MLADHGAMQVNVEPVERPGGGKPLAQLTEDCLERRLFDMSRRNGHGPQQRYQLPPGLTGVVDGTGDADIDAGAPVEDFLPS